jgi:hypothetical protein
VRVKSKETLDVFYGPDAQQVRAQLKKSRTDLVDWYEKLKSAAVEEQTASDATTEAMVLVLGGIGMVVGVAVAIFIVRSISREISKMVGLFWRSRIRIWRVKI